MGSEMCIRDSHSHGAHRVAWIGSIDLKVLGVFSLSPLCRNRLSLLQGGGRSEIYGTCGERSFSRGVLSIIVYSLAFSEKNPGIFTQGESYSRTFEDHCLFVGSFDGCFHGLA